MMKLSCVHVVIRSTDVGGMKGAAVMTYSWCDGVLPPMVLMMWNSLETSNATSSYPLWLKAAIHFGTLLIGRTHLCSPSGIMQKLNDESFSGWSLLSWNVLRCSSNIIQYSPQQCQLNLQTKVPKLCFLYPTCATHLYRVGQQCLSLKSKPLQLSQTTLQYILFWEVHSLLHVNSKTESSPADTLTLKLYTGSWYCPKHTKTSILNRLITQLLPS